MGGLRALLCCKGERPSDDQETANRPVEKPSTAQNTPESAKLPASSTGASQGKPVVKPEEDDGLETSEKNSPPRNLWKEAYDGLPPQLQKYVPAADIPATDAIQEVVDTTEAKYKEWQKGGLRYHRKSGKDIDIRDASEKIIGMAMKAKDTISTIVSFDPTGHASSAWTIISFGMSIVQNRLDRRDAVFEASAFLAENMAYFSLIDANYRDQGVGSDANVDQALLRTYSAILAFTAEVKKTRDENEASRLWYSISAFTDQAMSTLKDTVLAQKKATQEWASLASDLGNRERAKEILSNTDRLIESSKNMESKIMTVEEDLQLNWVSSADFSNRQDILQNKRTGNTGVWLLDSQEYNNWLSTPGGFLWLPGISGCGKSVLCSTVIGDLDEVCDLDGSKHYAYWYFEFGFDATQSVDALIRSLIRQLSQSPLPSSVVNLWKKHHSKGSQPDPNTIRRVLDEVLSGYPEGDHIYLIFDALDECPANGFPSKRESLLFLIGDLLERHKDRVHILATSRPERDIERELSKFPRVDLEERLAEDVRTFVDLAISRRLSIWNENIQKLIHDKLLSFKERRFRWAELQIEALTKQYDEADLRNALDSVPATLEKTYRNFLDSIEPQNLSRAREIFMLICLSPVPLDVDVVAKMVGLYHAEWVMTICTTSLLALNKKKVQVAHFSVQEFLIISEKTSEHHECQFTATEGHRLLTEKTVDILLTQTEPISSERQAMELPHFLYAADYWDTHLVAAGGFDELSPDVQAKVHRLFTESNVYLNWVRAADTYSDQIENQWSKLFAELEVPIHRASYLGLAQTAGLLAAQGADPLQRCGSVDRPEIKFRPTDSFNEAGRTGNLNVLQVLLDLGLPLPKQTIEELLWTIDYSKAGKVGLAKVLTILKDQGRLCDQTDDISDVIDELFVSAIARNERSGVEIFNVLLDWPTPSTPITEQIVCQTIKYSHSKDMPEYLFEKFNPPIPRVYIEQDFDELRSYPTAGLAYLALERPDEIPITENLLWLFARKGISTEIEPLLRLRKEDLHVTTRVLESAAANEQDARIFHLLWPHRQPGAEITEDMISNAAENEAHSSQLVTFLLQQPDPKPELSEELINDIIVGAHKSGGVKTLQLLLPLHSLGPPVPEDVVARICFCYEALDMLKLLEKEKGFRGPITESILQVAVLNESKAAPAVVDYLAQLSQDPLPVTEDVLLQAAQNTKQAGQVIKALAPYIPISSLTDGVFEQACENKDAMLALLDQKRRELPMEKILTKLSEGANSSFDDPLFGKTFQALLERQVVNVDEHVVELLAGSFHCSEALLSWKPDAPITENALRKAAREPRLMRLMMASHRDSLPVTDNVLLAATEGFSSYETMEVILSRRGSLPITEKLIIQATFPALHKRILIWLLKQQSESFVRNFWEKTWKTVGPEYNPFHFLMLTAFLQKTGSEFTIDMLEDWPYELPSGRNFNLGYFVGELCTNDDYPDMLVTQRAAEIVLERCDKKDVEVFLNHAELPITENLIQAAEKNVSEDKEELMKFLEQKRG